MDKQTSRLVARMLVHAGQDPDRLIEKAEKEKKEMLSSPAAHLRKCLRDQLVIDKFNRIKQELL